MTAITYLVTTDRDFAIKGNHRKQKDGDFVSFYYHKTVICQTMPGNTFWADNRGWNTHSINYTVGQYRIVLRALGYTEIEPPQM